LGTASFGLVDTTKAFWGGMSRVGVKNIRRAIAPFYAAAERRRDAAGMSPTSFHAVLANLRANWMNGTALPEQKAVAKSLLNLRLSPDTAKTMAAATGVDATSLGAVATAIQGGGGP